MSAPSFLFLGLAATIISIAPANAQNARKPPSALAQPTASADERWKALTTYADCKKLVVELGWSDWEGWYGCNTRNFKK